jgi:fumarate reductase subunit D
MSRKPPQSYRRNALWVAAMVHRLSGIALAVFLPIHFLVLGLSLQGAAKLDGFLRWTELPLVKLAEGALVFLLAIHFLGGLRVLAVENFDARGNQLRLATAAASLAAMVAFAFLIRVF